MQLRIKYIFLLLGFAVLFAACEFTPGNVTDRDGEVAEEDEHVEGEHEEGVVTITAAQRNAIDLEVGTMEMKNLAGVIRANGELEVPPQNVAKLSAIVGGNVAKINVIEGDKVGKGQALALLEHPDLIDLQTDLQEAFNNLQYLEKEFERQTRLYENKIGSGKQLQQITSEYQSAKSRVAGLKAKVRTLNLNPEKIIKGEIYQYIPVVSPISGFVKYVNITTGEYVSPQQQMFNIINTEDIHADLMVYEKDIFRVKEGQKVRFTVSNMPGKELEAEIYSIGKAFEEDPKALHVHAEILGEKGNLIPGMYVEGRILVEGEKVPALPEDAIVTEGEKSYIFVKAGEATAGKKKISEDEKVGHEKVNAGENVWLFKPVEVVRGEKDLGWVAVKPLEELSPNVAVAVSSAYYLMAEMKKGEAEHSH